MTKIQEALAKLDRANDNHWTEDGLPRMDTVKLLAGDQTLTREMLNAAVPNFSRFAEQKESAPINTAEASHVADGSAERALQTARQETQATRAEVSENLESARARLETAIARKEQADLEHKAATEEVDRFLEEQEKTGASEKLSDHVQGYFQAQNERLEQRTAQIERLKGIDLRTLMPSKAPIDAAFARKNSRGTGRPGA